MLVNINYFINYFLRIYNPLLSPNFNEYAYRSHIIDRLLSDIFLNLTSVQVITGEVDNENRKEQKKNSAETEERQSGRWKHDIVYYLKFSGMKFHIGFGEIVGDAFINDDRKMKNDLEKILKAMQLGLFELQSVLNETNIGSEIKKNRNIRDISV